MLCTVCSCRTSPWEAGWVCEVTEDREGSASAGEEGPHHREASRSQQSSGRNPHLPRCSLYVCHHSSWLAQPNSIISHSRPVSVNTSLTSISLIFCDWMESSFSGTCSSSMSLKWLRPWFFSFSSGTHVICKVMRCDKGLVYDVYLVRFEPL